MRIITLLASLSLATAAAAETQLTVWADATREPVFQAYHDLDNGVSLDITTIAPEELVTRLQLAMRAGSDVPDVVWISDIQAAAPISTRRTDYLAEMNDLVDPAVLAEFAQGANSPCIVGGRLVCLRNDVAPYVIWYNKPQLEELGVAIPQTWEEFRDTGNALAEQGMVVGTSTTPFLLLAMIASSGCEIAIPVEGADETLAIDLTSDACLAAARLIDDMRASGALSNFGAFDAGFAQGGVSGNIPMMQGPTWFGEFVIKARFEFEPGTLTAAPPPRWSWQDTPLSWSGGGGAFGVWKDSESLDAAVDLAVWATTDLDIQTNAVTTPAHGPSAEAWYVRAVESGYYADEAFTTAMEQAVEMTHPGFVPLRFNVGEAIGTVVVPAFAAGRTLEEMLPELQTELENLARLNRYQIQ